MSKLVGFKSVVIGLASLLCFPALAEDGVDARNDPVVLQEFRVTAPAEPLDQSLLLLRRLAEMSLPCLGCSIIRTGASENPALSLLELLLLPSVPPIEDRADRLATEIRYQDFGADLGDRR